MLGFVTKRNTIRIDEALGKLLLERKDGNVFEVVLITAGEGSSGNYTPELLEQSVSAFPKGTKHWFKHLGWMDSSGHDPRDQWGVTIEDAWYDPAREAIVAKSKVFPRWLEVIEDLVAEGQAEMSISAAAAINEETGELIAILYHRTNSVDLVDYAGRPGSEIVQKIERARESYKPGAASASVEKGSNMDEEKVKALIESALDAKLAPLMGFVNESAATKAQEAQAKVDAGALSAAGEKAVEAYRAADALIAEADLLAPQVADLRERAAKGEDITKALESAKSIKEAAVAAAKQSVEEGVGIGNGAAADEDWSVTL
jgi:hypothetical protein